MRRMVSAVGYYSIWMIVAAVLEMLSVRMAYIERGYKAIGGEWLVLPVVMLVAWFIRDFLTWLRDEKEEEWED